MATKKIKHVVIDSNEQIEILKDKVLSGLQNAAFYAIDYNQILNQYTAKYRNLSVKGEIKLTLVNHNNGVKIDVLVKGNSNSILGLFNAPANYIYNQFSNHFN